MYITYILCIQLFKSINKWVPLDIGGIMEYTNFKNNKSNISEKELNNFTNILNQHFKRPITGKMKHSQ